ncbi:MAG: LTA synthase family protein [Erysipelotrichaceae bacterium]
MIFISLGIYVLFGLLVYPLIPTVLFRTVFAGVYLLFLILDAGAIYAKGTHFSLAFAANIERKVIEMMFTTFLPLTISVVVGYVIALILIFLNDDQIVRFSQTQLLSHVAIVVMIVLFSLSKDGVLYNVVKTVKALVVRNNAETITEIEQDFDFQERYQLEETLHASAGKNVIVIYLESFENNFLNEDYFPGLMPKLKERMQRWNVYEHYVPYGGIDYTMGALYGTQTGLPNYFGLKGNNVFANITESRATSIGNILHQAGYQQVYLNGGDLLFAGKGNFFEKNHYQTYGVHDFDASLPRSEWGVHDADLFAKATVLLEELRATGKPYNVTMLTLDLHFPDGLVDPRIEGKYGQMHGILQAAMTLDDELDAFLTQLEQQPDYENTAVYIMGDHPLMGINTITRQLAKEHRELFVLTNQPPTPSYPDVRKPIYFYDVPKLILEGAQVVHNGHFLPDLLPQVSYAYLDKHVGDFTAFNFLLHEFSKIDDDVYLVQEDNDYILRSGRHNLKKFQLQEGRMVCFVLDQHLNIIATVEMNLNSHYFNGEDNYTNHSIIGYYLEEGHVQSVLMNQELKIVYQGDGFEKIAKKQIQKLD